MALQHYHKAFLAAAHNSMDIRPHPFVTSILLDSRLEQAWVHEAVPLDLLGLYLDHSD